MQLCRVIIAAVGALLLAGFMTVFGCLFKRGDWNTGYSYSRLQISEGHMEVLKQIAFGMYCSFGHSLAVYSCMFSF